MEFSDVGAHCSISTCQRKDFLPFTCDCCRGLFCLDHRTYDSHECPLSGTKDNRIIECPLCLNSIQLIHSEDPNTSWERHALTSCNPKDYKEKKKKKICCAENCRTTLGPSNFIHCKLCRRDVCFSHRFESDHQCKPMNSINQPKTLLSSLLRSNNNNSTTKNTNRKNPPKTNSKVTTTTNASESKSSSLPRSTKNEVCPHCGKSFVYLAQWIVHMNSQHGQTEADSVSSTSNNSASELCPHCSATFVQVGDLIAHVERLHVGTHSASTSSSFKKDCTVM